MSIIQEALRKAQIDIKPSGERSGTPEAKNKPEVKAPSGAAVKKISKSNIPSATIIASIALIALMAFAFFSARQFLLQSKKDSGKDTAAFQEVTYKPIVKTEAAPSDTSSTQSQPAAPSAPRSVADHPDLTLNGIMYLEEGARAIINNSIVETGDSVSGATVTKINPKNVVLEYNDVEITLSLK